MNKLLTPSELSQKLSVPISTVYYWVHIKYVPCLKLGKYLRFPENKIDAWLVDKEKEVINYKKFFPKKQNHRPLEEVRVL